VRSRGFTVSTAESPSRPGKRKGAGLDDTAQDKVNELGGSGVALAVAADHVAQERRQHRRTEVMAPLPASVLNAAHSSYTPRGELGRLLFELALTPTAQFLHAHISALASGLP
jgi:hypothetical protein